MTAKKTARKKTRQAVEKDAVAPSARKPSGRASNRKTATGKTAKKKTSAGKTRRKKAASRRTRTPTPAPSRHTMKDLAAATGFTTRQIRYYVTKQLVPGAGAKGPGARYGDDSLTRLRLIAQLKETRLPPAGRTPTLDDMRAMFESMGDRGVARLIEKMSRAGARPGRQDARLPRSVTRSLEQAAHREADRARETDSAVATPPPAGTPAALRPPSEAPRETRLLPPRGSIAARRDVVMLMHRLRDAMDALTGTGATGATGDAPGAERWLRLGHLDLEFLLREPVGADDRARYAELAAALQWLLDRMGPRR